MINQIIQGDCLEVLKSIPDNYFDSLITDPPCGISFMGKNWDSHKGGMLQWINWMSEVMAESLRVMKPGACGLVWSIPRTSHWTGMALELAGFRLIDCVHHCFGSGFPKGQDIGKILDKMAGEEREIVGQYLAPDGKPRKHDTGIQGGNYGNSRNSKPDNFPDKLLTAPSTFEAKQWDGWKTPALKPAVEGWWLVQKPISESSIARNILKHGVGGLNIEACRIGTEESLSGGSVTTTRKNPMSGDDRQGKSLGMFAEGSARKDEWTQPNGRYPANLILSCSADCDGDRHSPDCPVSVIGEQSGICVSGGTGGSNKGTFFKGLHNFRSECEPSTGTAARYFKQLPFDPETIHSVYYQAKASTKDRSSNGAVNNVHPTVKSTALMEYFIKLITPPGGIVLDPFGGSGTTGVAAKNLGFNYTLIEKEQEYIDIINQRLDTHASASDLEINARSPQTQKNKVISIEKHKQLSLFG